MRNRFGAILIASSILFAGCEIDEDAFADIKFEKQFLVGTAGEDEIDVEKNIFNEDELIGIELFSGNEKFNTSKISFRVSIEENSYEQLIDVFDMDIVPTWGWIYIPIGECYPGDYIIRAYVGLIDSGEYFGEVRFSVTE